MMLDMEQATDTPNSPSSPWLRKWPGFQRSASGLEWVLWCRLPYILLVGVSVPCVVALAAGMTAWLGEVDAATQRQLTQWIYMMVGLVILHLTLVLTLAIGCVIVMVMKGPAYVADPYFLDGSTQPLQRSTGQKQA
jgi:hypothetical protein